MKYSPFDFVAQRHKVNRVYVYGNELPRNQNYVCVFMRKCLIHIPNAIRQQKIKLWKPSADFPINLNTKCNLKVKN